MPDLQVMGLTPRFVNWRALAFQVLGTDVYLLDILVSLQASSDFNETDNRQITVYFLNKYATSHREI